MQTSALISQIIAVCGILSPGLIAFGVVMWRLGTRVSLLEKTVVDQASQVAQRESDRDKRDAIRDIATEEMRKDIRIIRDQQTLAQGIAIGIAQQQAHHPNPLPPGV